MKKILLYTLMMMNVASLVYAGPTVKFFKLSQESEEWLINKKIELRIKLVTDQLEVFFLTLNHDIDMEINSFFRKAIHNSKDYSEQASKYYLDTKKNRNELKQLYEKLIYSEQNLKMLQRSIAQKIRVKLKDKLEAIFNKYFIVCDDINTTIVGPINVRSNIDTGYMTGNKIALASQVVTTILDLVYGPAGFFKSLAFGFGLDCINPITRFNKPEEGIERQVLNHIANDSKVFKVQIDKMLKESFRKSKEKVDSELRSLLKIQFGGANR